MEKTYSGGERRRYKRVRMKLNVYFRKNEPVDVRLMEGQEEIESQMLDISEGGVSIISGKYIPVLTVLKIRVTLASTQQQGVSYFGSITVLGEVRNIIPFSQSEFRVGIAFSKIDEESRHQVAGFVNIIDSAFSDNK